MHITPSPAAPPDTSRGLARKSTIASRYDLSIRTIDRMIARGVLDAVREGGTTWITVASAEAWAARLARAEPGTSPRSTPGFERVEGGRYRRRSRPAEAAQPPAAGLAREARRQTSRHRAALAAQAGAAQSADA